MKLLLIAVAFVLVGCAAQSFNEKLAAGYSATNGAMASTTALLNAKKIHSSDGQHVLDTAAVVEKGLVVARELNKTDPKAATAKVDSMRAILAELKAYLTLKEKQ